MKKVIILIVVLVVIFGGFYAYKILKQQNGPGIIQEPVACTEEAKICPDGSAVGRVAPLCEFAACPDVGSSTSNIVGTSDWKTYKNEQYGFEFKYPTFLDGSGASDKLASLSHKGTTVIGVYSFDEYKQLEDFYQEYKNVGTITINNQIIAKVSSNISVDNPFTKKTSTISKVVYLFKIGESGIGISFDQNPENGITREIENTVLSTFKFTK